MQAIVSEWPSRPDVAAVAAIRSVIDLVGPAGAEFARNAEYLLAVTGCRACRLVSRSVSSARVARRVYVAVSRAVPGARS